MKAKSPKIFPASSKVRSALRLPRYVLRKRLRSGAVAYFFSIPGWAREAGCLVKNEPLGIDYDAAVKRAETVLLPAFDSWRLDGATDNVEPFAKAGTLDWVFAEYRKDRRFKKLDKRTRRNHEVGFRLVGKHELKDGRLLGRQPVAAITPAVIDALYEKLRFVTETKKDGTTITRSRLTTINHAMKTCRRAWNVAARLHGAKLPQNPFSKMGLESSSRETPTATYAELQAFRGKAIELGMPSLATAALVGWEWLQRERDIFCRFSISDYRPKERPNAVRVIHHKTKIETWIPLTDDDGALLYPELTAELDALVAGRVGGLVLRRDWGERLPWPSGSDKDELTHMSRKVKEVIFAAGLRRELTFTSFSHGGFTESADADLTDAEIRAAGRHKSAKVLPKYAKRTMKQVATAAKKRRASRTDGEHLSECADAVCQNELADAS